MKNTTDSIDVVDLENAIKILHKCAKEPNVLSLIPKLEALKKDINNELLLAQLTDAWRNLGVYQGAVLTYVPYFYTMIPDDIFGDKE